MNFYQVDSFTNERFRGNPAAVCLLPEARDEAWMQSVASEMNLSETAFLLSENGSYDLRWFTPTVEVDLCGHATLASAHVLWEAEIVPADAAIAFTTRSGTLTAARRGEWIEMDFPATPEEPGEPNIDFERALGAPPTYVGKSKFDYLVEVASEQVVRDLQPDIALLKHADARGVIVTAQATSEGFDFVSRFFAPRSGVAEDPVTGSAHCCLAPYWGRRLGKTELVGFQASHRGGTVRVRLEGLRVVLGGQAVTVFRFELS